MTQIPAQEPHTGLFKVKVMRASGISTGEKCIPMGKADQYAVVKWVSRDRPQEHKTSVHRRGEPVWDEFFDFFIVSPHDRDEPLRIVLKKRHLFKKDEVVGETIIPNIVRHVQEHGGLIEAKLYPVIYKENHRGDIRVSFTFQRMTIDAMVAADYMIPASSNGHGHGNRRDNDTGKTFADLAVTIARLISTAVTCAIPMF